MAWLGLDKLFLGVDLDAEQQRSNQSDAQLQQLLQKGQEMGYYDAAYIQQANADINAGNESTGVVDVTGSVNSEFVAGAKEGLNNVLAAPGKAVGMAGDLSGKLLGGILKNIPWWLWLAAAGAVFVWMGGLTLLKGRFARS